jgi:glyoxylase-like metal-dependent hydrolase (beta-lactamase superfamily II)
MQHEIVVVGEYEVNCVLLWQDPAAAWVVDPGGDAPRIREAVARHRLQVARYLCTHGHVDHLSALNELLASHPAPVWMHPADARWAFSARNCILPDYPAYPAPPADLQTQLTDSALLADGALAARVLFVPGHTPGGICLHFEPEKLLLTGDTLFAGSAGRTDFAGGDPRQMRQSLQRLAALPAETRVIAGHGPGTTIGNEKRRNPYLRGM